MKGKIVSVFLASILCLGIVGCGSSKEKESGGVDSTTSESISETEQGDFKNISPRNGAEISILNSEMESFCEQETLVGTLVDAYVTKTDCFAPQSIEFSWSCEKAILGYTLTVALDENFTEIVTTCNVVGDSVVLENPYTGCEYFWKVNAIAESGEVLKSGTLSFKVKATPRPVSIQGVSNTRDLGGYATPNGRVKQGMIYRTAKFDDITPEGKSMAIDGLKIKTDLDLRNTGEGTAGMQSPLGCENYLRLSSPYYEIFSADQKAQVREIMKVFADESNYPIAMHCSLGRDRTGTIAFLINALLGVEERDLRMDYFLSAFSHAGSALDNATFVILEGNFERMYGGIYGTYSGETYAEKVESYLLSAGVTTEEIQAIKRIMLAQN